MTTKIKKTIAPTKLKSAIESQYDLKRREINSQIYILKRRMKKFDDDFKIHQTWGHVGSLGKVIEDLREVNNFIKIYIP